MTTLDDFRAALDRVAAVLAENEPRHGGRWRRETVYAHVCHALAHLEVWKAERTAEDLEHALVRVMMAVEMTMRDAEGADLSIRRANGEDAA